MTPRARSIGIRLGLFCMAVSGVVSACTLFGPKGPATNPDPNHTHADFAIRVLGQELDFSDARYMSGVSDDDASHDEEGEYLHKHLHLHDDIGTVIHRHKPGLTLGDFLDSIGLHASAGCLTLDDAQFESIDPGERESWALTKDLCITGKHRWRMFVNGQERPYDPAYVFQDLDKILLTYGAGDMVPQAELDALTDDACLYSRTCPERGDPPAENCVADPEVPCVVPEGGL
jgi:hypothetical protein